MTNQINISFTNENKLKIILDDKLLDPNLFLAAKFATEIFCHEQYKIDSLRTFSSD